MHNCLRNCKATQSTRLLVVSKLQTPQTVETLFGAGQTAFGETDISELHLKANALSHLPIRWRFLGHLQSSKVGTLLKIPNLSAFEALDSIKLAHALTNAINTSNNAQRTLKVLCEVNTALDGSNFGIDYRDYKAIEHLAKHVIASGALKFAGLMTVGNGSKECFSRLNLVKKQLVDEVPECAKLDAEKKFQMSMGTSEGWRDAVELGSTQIRINSAIFL